MKRCPNCGSFVSGDVCPACGTVIPKETENKPNTSTSSTSSKGSPIEQLKKYTSDFTKKPSCSDSEFKNLVVDTMVNSSSSEKNIYEDRIKAYSNNYLNGGTGVVVVCEESTAPHASRFQRALPPREKAESMVPGTGLEPVSLTGDRF